MCVSCRGDFLFIFELMNWTKLREQERAVKFKKTTTDVSPVVLIQ